MNLKDETIKVLQHYGKTVDEINWIGCRDFTIPCDLFWQLADKEYDSGFGAQEVASDLIIVGNNWWLERYEYDGSEHWEYKQFPIKPDKTRVVDRVMLGKHGWSSLYDLNK